MTLDYASYDAVQLQQALRSVDADRFPERAREIEARLAALPLQAESELANPGIISAAAPILQNAGMALIAAGLIGAVLNLFNSGARAVDITFILPLVVGVLLWRRSLGVASVVRWLACLMVPGLAFIEFTALAIQPLDLTATQARLDPWSLLLGIVVALLKCGLAWWLWRELGRPEVLAARVADGRKLRDMRIPLVLGVAGAVVGVVMQVTLLGGANAERASAMAAQKYGSAYHYHTNGLYFYTNGKKTFVSASVLAWNDQQILAIPVKWQD